MAPCANCRQERPVRPYAYALGRRVTVLCDECHASLSAIGMSLTLVERRAVEQPVATERRRFVPVWRRQPAPAKDLTGRVAA